MFKELITRKGWYFELILTCSISTYDKCYFNPEKIFLNKKY